MKSERYNKGLEIIKKINGKQGEQIFDVINKISPDFAEMVVEFAFGDICSRPGLDLKSREIATVAALTAMGTATPQLKLHIQAALNVGCTREELIEIMIQMAVYAGVPAALNGLFTLKEVIDEPVTNPT